MDDHLSHACDSLLHRGGLSDMDSRTWCLGHRDRRRQGKGGKGAMNLIVIDADTGDEYWTSDQCADHCGISRSSWSAYVSRGTAPLRPLISMSGHRYVWSVRCRTGTSPGPARPAHLELTRSSALLYLRRPGKPCARRETLQQATFREADTKSFGVTFPVFRCSL